MECVKAKVEAIGLDNFEGQNLDDLKDFTEIAKNIACFDKDYRIVEAMEKSEDNEDVMRMVEQYEDYPDRRFYDNYRYANGRLAPKGRGTRRGYIEPLYFHQMPDDYRTWEDKPMQERMRDLDRMSGRMHYTEPTTATRDSREGKSGMMRRSYIEAKEMHKDKDTTMQELEKYLKGVSEDITDVIGNMTPEERSMLKSKMSTLVTKL